MSVIMSPTHFKKKKKWNLYGTNSWYGMWNKRCFCAVLVHGTKDLKPHLHMWIIIGFFRLIFLVSFKAQNLHQDTPTKKNSLKHIKHMIDIWHGFHKQWLKWKWMYWNWFYPHTPFIINPADLSIALHPDYSHIRFKLVLCSLLTVTHMWSQKVWV